MGAIGNLINATGQFIGNGITDIGDALGIGAARRDREFNAQEAQKQRDWETEMSNTAYQRQIADMKEAGINPASIYAAGGGNGASTPTSTAARSGGNSNNNIAGLFNAAANFTRASQSRVDDSKIINTAIKVAMGLMK